MSTTTPPQPPQHQPRGLPRPFVAVCVAFGVLAVLWTGLSLVSLTSHETATTSRTYAAGRELTLTASSGDVTVISEDRDDVRVDAQVGWSLAQPDVELRREGDRLVLDGDCGFWADLGPTDCSTEFEVRVPRATTIDARSDSGDVAAAGVDGDVRLDSGSGDLEARDVGGALTLETGSGDIVVDGLRGGEVAAKSGSGDVTVRAQRAPTRLAARSGSGDMMIVLPDAVYRVTTETGSGDQQVQVRQDPDSPRIIEARSGSGDILVARLQDAR